MTVNERTNYTGKLLSASRSVMLHFNCGVSALEYIAVGDFVNKWLRVSLLVAQLCGVREN